MSKRKSKVYKKGGDRLITPTGSILLMEVSHVVEQFLNLGKNNRIMKPRFQGFFTFTVVDVFNS